jgi:hypothetical protein
MKAQLKKSFIATAAKALLIVVISCTSSHSRSNESEQHVDNKQKIMLALLLDTSNSMDGLIDQAKSQLWTIVNELASAKCQDGTPPDINIALFEYGNSGLPSSEGYIRMVVNLTNDLDEISEKLFSLRTNGGDEFCGQVIKRSIDQLSWSTSEADLKMIFIAGNEPFTQGNISYNTACNLAKDNNIVVNTIFCGPYGEGINTSWKSGADITGGSYMSIEQDRKTVYMKTPHDDKIDQLNDQLNKTYIYYGTEGKQKMEKQRQQDDNAASYSQANKVKRAISKSSHVYKNSDWDVIDAFEEDEEILEKLDEKDLPEEMKEMDNQERKEYVQKQSQLRTTIQKEIQTLSVKRKQYIAENQAKENQDGMLDQAMIKSIKEVAKTKNLTLE